MYARCGADCDGRDASGRARFGVIGGLAVALERGHAVHQVRVCPGIARPATALSGNSRRNRYSLTRDGLLFACFYTKIYDHLLRPLMAPDRPNAPPELLIALDPLDQLVADHITKWVTP